MAKRRRPGIAGVVDRRLAGGWRPAATVDRTWVRGAIRLRVDGERVEGLTYADAEPMSEAEENELIHRVYSEPDRG